MARNKRRVIIGGDEDRRGQRFGRFPQGGNEPLGPVTIQRPKHGTGRIIVPTGDRRHMTKIRLGKLDTSICFSRAYRESIQVDPDVELDQGLASREAIEGELEKLSGREKGADNAEGKKQGATKKVLRSRKAGKDQQGDGEKTRSSRKGVQKAAKPRAVKAKVKSKAKPVTKKQPSKKTVTKPKAKAPVKRKPVKRKVTK